MKTLDGIGTMQYAVFTNNMLMLVNGSQLKWDLKLVDIKGLEFNYTNKVQNCIKCEDIISHCQNNCKIGEKIFQDKGDKYLKSFQGKKFKKDNPDK